MEKTMGVFQVKGGVFHTKCVSYLCWHPSIPKLIILITSLIFCTSYCSFIRSFQLFQPISLLKFFYSSIHPSLVQVNIHSFLHSNYFSPLLLASFSPKPCPQSIKKREHQNKMGVGQESHGRKNSFNKV